MREHKYRAWDISKKVMYSADELGADQETLSVDGRGFVNVSGDSTRLSQFHTHLLPLEYTGLKDMNGKEIYEGDILLVPTYPSMSNPNSDPDLCEVVYDSGSFGYRQGGMIEMFYSLYGNGVTQIDEEEIIGNIYEKKELLNND